MMDKIVTSKIQAMLLEPGDYILMSDQAYEVLGVSTQHQPLVRLKLRNMATQEVRVEYADSMLLVSWFGLAPPTHRECNVVPANTVVVGDTIDINGTFGIIIGIHPNADKLIITTKPSSITPVSWGLYLQTHQYALVRIIPKN